MPQLYKRPSRLVRRRKPTPVKPKPRSPRKSASTPPSVKPKPRKSAYPQASKNRAWEFDSKRNAWVSVPKYPNVTPPKQKPRKSAYPREYEDFKPLKQKPTHPPPKQKPTPGYTWVWDVANSRWVQRRK